MSWRLNMTIQQLNRLLLIGAFAMVLPLHWSYGHDATEHTSKQIRKSCSGLEADQHANSKNKHATPLQDSPSNDSSKHDHKTCLLCHALAGMFTPPIRSLGCIDLERFITIIKTENRKLIFDARLFDFSPRPPPVV